MVRMLMMLEQLKTVTPPTESKPLMCEEEKKAFDAVTKALDTYIDVHNKCAVEKGLEELADFSDPYHMLGVTYVNDAVEDCVKSLKCCKSMVENVKEYREVIDETCKEQHTTVGKLAYDAVMKRVAHSMFKDLFRGLFS